MLRKTIFRPIQRVLIVTWLLWHPLALVKAQMHDNTPIVNYQKSSLTLQEIIRSIEEQTEFRFSYDPDRLQISGEVKLPSSRLSIQETLTHLYRKFDITGSLSGKVIILKQGDRKPKRRVTLRGVVVDSVTGEYLAGTSIRLTNTDVGIVSNGYGFFSITFRAGERQAIEVHHLGYRPFMFPCSFSEDSTVNIHLSPQSVFLTGVVIEGEEDTDKSIRHAAGSVTLSQTKVKDIVSFGGEPDALKSLQLMPGVQVANEGTTGMSVRGGSYDQNLFLLDEAPVYNPSHALGFFSVFNPDAIQSITLYKSEIPVSYGGRLSSVVSVRTKEGNRYKKRYTGALGLIASRLSIEGPISRKSDKASFIVSGRYSYAGRVVNAIYLAGQYVFRDPTAHQSTVDNKIGFYDMNVKLNYRKNDRNHFYLSMYSGHDTFYFNRITNGYALAWGNQTASLRWNHIHTSKVFSNTTVLFSHYNYQYDILNNTQYFTWKADFREFRLKQDYDYYLNTNNHVIFGLGVEQYQSEPGTVTPRNERAASKTYSLQNQRTWSVTGYAGNEQRLSEKIRLKYGVRYSAFILSGPFTRFRFEGRGSKPLDSLVYSRNQIETVYHRLDPRACISWQSHHGTFSLSYDRTTQDFRLVSNSSVGLPTDIWMPSGGSIKPQHADIYAFQWQHAIRKLVEGSVGFFYKDLFNIVDFKDNADLFVNRYIESQLLTGRGSSFGAEFFLHKSIGKFQTSASYTWSKTLHHISFVNGGNRFSPPYDKRHKLSITSNISLSKRWQASLNFVYSSGSRFTVPSGNFTFDNISFNAYTERNAYVLPDYHRMDISFKYHRAKNSRRRFQSFWSFDVYNVYGRKNPFTIYSQPIDYGFEVTQVSAIYLFKVVPSVSYNFTF